MTHHYHVNAAATRHVNETVSIVWMIMDGQTCEVLRRHDGIGKGWTILHRISHVEPSESGRTNVPRTDAVIAGAVLSVLEMGNRFSRATVSRRTLMSFFALMFAPGSHCA
jgi:hypothetical protein